MHLHRPGDSDSDSETATATCEDGATASATATAYAYVPSATIAKQVTVDVLHKEHVKAETVERSPIAGSRDEALALASSVGADDPFEALVLPEAEPVEPPAEQEPADGDLSDWFDLAGMGSGRGEASTDGNPSDRGPRWATTGAVPPEEQAMLDAFDRVLTAMAYAASGLCLFAIVWAGFVLMAEGAEERGGGRAKSAVVMAVVGLVLVLLAKAVAALLRSGLVDFPTP